MTIEKSVSGPAAEWKLSGWLDTQSAPELEAVNRGLDANSDFTEAALLRLGFKWPVSGEKYIVSMLRALDELAMFEGQ